MDQEMATMLLTADEEKGIVATHCTVCRWSVLRYVEVDVRLTRILLLKQAINSGVFFLEHFRLACTPHAS